jgi:DNA helicase-2/ATP-dependent DNA helicase PcrA
MKLESELKKLNDNQLQAVNKLYGPLLVLAGPGSGKTQLLALRVANILKQTHANARNILCLTYTDAASINMRERLSRFIGHEAGLVHINTFHGFGMWVRDEYPEHFNNSFSFSPISSVEEKEIFTEIFENLEVSDPLSNFSEAHGFSYQNSAEQHISNLINAGISPYKFSKILDWNQKYYEIISKLIKELPTERMSKKTAPKFIEILKVITEIDDNHELYGQKSFAYTIGQAAKLAIDDYEETGKTNSVTEWKKNFIEKENDSYVLKQAKLLEKARSLNKIYQKYLETLEKEGKYNFSHMILDLISLLENHPDVLYSIQEKFQFILIDEFQDTSPAQMRIIELLSHDSLDQNPNIMAVGDDDQAIYSFQGADSSNIEKFVAMLPKCELIILDKNYRSTQPILDLAMFNISKSEKRLTNKLPNVTKNLQASNPAIAEGKIHLTLHNSPEAEIDYITNKINQLISSGLNPSDIAIIGRKNRQLSRVAKSLIEKNIPVFFEKDTNILEHSKIQEIIAILKLINLWSSTNIMFTDLYLHKVLNQEHIGIPKIEIVKLTVESHKSQISLRELIESKTDSVFKRFCEVMNYYSSQAEYLPVEILIHKLIGGDIEESLHFNIKKHYFDDSINADKLSFYTSLSSFVKAVREYKSGKNVSLSDLLRFVEVCEKNKIEIQDSHPIRSSLSAVNLLTAHKSKGLEFEHVFIIHADANTWGKGRNNNKITLPPNLILRKNSDEDEIIRLQYVALTRAKSHLYISRYQFNESGKETLRLNTVYGNEEYIESHDLNLNKIFELPLYAGKEFEDIDAHLIAEYTLNPTGLEAFLDISRGGPQSFKEKQLYHFPSPKTFVSALGSAVHYGLQFLYKDNLDDTELLQALKDYLEKQRVTDKDREKIFLQGSEILINYYRNEYLPNRENPYKKMFLEKKIETSIEDARIKGTMDAIFIDDDNKALVVDYKTSKPISSLTKAGVKNEEKAHKYKLQLYCYALILKNAYPEMDIEKGSIYFVKETNGNIKKPYINFNTEELERTKKLIVGVNRLIKNGIFPDISTYSTDLSGRLAFEEDILSEKYG